MVMLKDEINYVNLVKRLQEEHMLTLRDFVDGDVNDYIKIADKGSFGKLVETIIFEKDLDNKKKADLQFDTNKYELKVVPYNESKKNKERMVLSMIDYNNQFDDSFFSSSLFLEKLNHLLCICYIDKKDGDILNNEIFDVYKFDLYDVLTEQQRNIIELDYRIIAVKIKAGLAHEISGSDTKILKACTKASSSKYERAYKYNENIKAKPRAFSFNASFVKILLEQSREVTTLKTKSMTEIERLLYNLVGINIKNINLEYNFGVSENNKSFRGTVLKHFLKKNLGDNYNNSREMIENNLYIITGQMKKNGKLKEDYKLCRWNVQEIINIDFEDSHIYELLCKEFRMIIFDLEDNILEVVNFKLSMDEINEYKKIYEDTRYKVQNKNENCIMENGGSTFIKKSANLVGFSRSATTKSCTCHGEKFNEIKNSISKNDIDNMDITIGGYCFTKQGFWLSTKFTNTKLRGNNESS